MAFADWIPYNNGLNGAGGEPALGTSTSFFGGSSSLVMSGTAAGRTSGPDGVSSSGNVVADTLPKGFLHGKIRTLINPVSSGPANHGVVAMMSQEDLAGGAGGKGYAVVLDSVLFDNNVHIVRLNNGSATSVDSTIPSTYAELGRSADNIWLENNVYAIELEWHVDARLGGVHLIGRFGTALDYSDLTIFAQATDCGYGIYTGPSVGEGVFCNLTTNSMIVAFENTSVFSMIPL